MRSQSRRVISLTILLILIAAGVAACSQRVPVRTERTKQPITAFVYTYNENAIPELPPDYSASSSIWNLLDGIPARPVNTEPEFIEHPKPIYSVPGASVLSEAKCSGGSDYLYDCQDDSPLRDFECEKFTNPYSVGGGLEPAHPIIALCWHDPYSVSDSDEDFLYRVGCERTFNISYIFKIKDEYILVNTLEKMKELFAPIDSPDEALSYAQILTGMYPLYEFSYHPDYMIYYLDVIEATHVTPTDTGYLVHLYQTDECGCDSWLTSQVDVIINSDGSIEWGSATPVYQKVCEGLCLD